jgi:hypothetical protein
LRCGEIREVAHVNEPEPNREPAGSALTATTIESLPGWLQPYMRAVLERAHAGLAEPFAGITAGGPIPPGLYPVKPTGVSLEAVAGAARAFSAALTPEQRHKATFDIASDMWRRWHNMHFCFFRHGVVLEDLDDAQRAAALALVRSTLSAAGYENARDVMKLNEHIAELTGRREAYGEWYYYMSLFGEPSPTQPWGWQIDGHHLIINCFVLGDQLVLTPYFSGSEPVAATSGKYAGTQAFQAEQSAGIALMKALSTEQQDIARIGMALPRDVLTNAQVDNLNLPYAGIRWDALAPAQRERLLELIAVYVGRIRPGHAEIRMDEVREHLDATHFAWIGACDDTSPFYYRIQSPVILIEFDHLPGVAFNNAEPSRAHVHTIVRTPNGNDYGRDLLRQHYAEHDHSRPGAGHRHGE